MKKDFIAIKIRKFLAFSIEVPSWLSFLSLSIAAWTLEEVGTSGPFFICCLTASGVSGRGEIAGVNTGRSRASLNICFSVTAGGSVVYIKILVYLITHVVHINMSVNDGYHSAFIK